MFTNDWLKVSHLRSFLQRTAVNGKTHNWFACREQVTIECSALNGATILHPPPQDSGRIAEVGADRL